MSSFLSLPRCSAHVRGNACRAAPDRDAAPQILRRDAILGAAACLGACTPSSQATSSGTLEREPYLATQSAAAPAAYDDFADAYDSVQESAANVFGFPRLRQQVVSRASGAVLETGVGTGINLPFYDYALVTQLTALDVSRGMLEQARAKLRYIQAGDRVRLVQGTVDAIPFETASFDCVVDTFSLCVYADPVQALREMARVVKPDGRVRLLEHSRSENPALGWYQDLTAAAVAASAKGCVWNQNVPELLVQAGLRPVSIRHEVGGTVALIEAVRMS